MFFASGDPGFPVAGAPVSRLNPAMKAIAALLLLLASPAFAAETKSASAAAEKKSAVKNVGVEEFDKLRQQKDTVVLDVRTADEHASGHLKGAVLLDFRAADFADQVAKLDKDKTYLVHCAAGGRSAKACTKMEGLGFKRVVNLEGGLGAWKDAGKPVEK